MKKDDCITNSVSLFTAGTLSFKTHLFRYVYYTEEENNVFVVRLDSHDSLYYSPKARTVSRTLMFLHLCLMSPWNI